MEHDKEPKESSFTANCGNCQESNKRKALKIGNAVKKFKQEGWTLTRKHGWLCPKCCKNLKEEEQQI